MMLVTMSIWRYNLWRGVMRFGMKKKLSPRYVGPWDSTVCGWGGQWVCVACGASFCSSSLSCLYVEVVPRWSSINPTCRWFGGLWKLFLWGNTCWDLKQTGQEAEEQGDCHTEGIVEKSSCGGCYMGGRGRHEIPISPSFQLLRLDFLLVRL